MDKRKQQREYGRKSRREHGRKPHIGAIKPAAWLLFTLFLAAAFILFSMFCVRKLIKARENNLLAGKGTIKQTSPVSGSLKSEKGEKVVLTTKEIQEIMKKWDRRIGLFSHEPVEGQIAMSEAIKAVDEWLLKMGLSEGILSGNSTVYSTLNVARLKGEKPAVLSPAYSFWEVSVNGDKLTGTFYVNAVTGRIFEAHITMGFEAASVTKDQLLKSFIRLAGLKPKEQKKSYELDEAVKQGGRGVILSGLEPLGIPWDDSQYMEAEAGIVSEEASSAAGISIWEQDWSISTEIADSSMVARVNCFYGGEYYDENEGAYNKKAVSRPAYIEIAFCLQVEE